MTGFKNEYKILYFMNILIFKFNKIDMLDENVNILIVQNIYI